MGLLPEREPIKNPYENPDEVSALNIERKEVVTPILSKFSAQVTDDQGNPVISISDDKKADIVIPEIDLQTLEIKAKGDGSESSVWSASYWIRIFKKAIFFGWKILFDRKN